MFKIENKDVFKITVWGTIFGTLVSTFIIWVISCIYDYIKTNFQYMLIGGDYVLYVIQFLTLGLCFYFYGLYIKNKLLVRTKEKVVKNEIRTEIQNLQQLYCDKVKNSLTPHDFFAIMRCNYNEYDNSLHFHIHNQDSMNFLLCYDIETVYVIDMNKEFSKYQTILSTLPREIKKIELYFEVSFFSPDNHNNIIILSENDYDLWIRSENTDIQIPSDKKIILSAETLSSFKKIGKYTELQCKYKINNNEMKQKISQLFTKTNKIENISNTMSFKTENKSGLQWECIKQEIKIYVSIIYL